MSTVADVSNAGSGMLGQTVKGTKGMKPEDFLKIMIKELQQQDPFEPISSKDLLDQVGQIREIQGSMDLTAALKDLTVYQKLAAGGSMLGKLVEGIDSTGENVEGLVLSVRIEDEKVYLELDSGRRLLLDNVVKVHSGTGLTDQTTLAAANPPSAERR